MTDMLKKAAIQVLSEVHPGNEPGFIIAGAQKSATTSLHYYLNQHPDLQGSNPKEVCYFHDDRNYGKGKEWYKKAFVNFRNGTCPISVSVLSSCEVNNLGVFSHCSHGNYG